MDALKLLEDYTPEHLKMYAYRYKLGLKETKLKIISYHLGDIKNLYVLDVGCGIGIFSNFCYKRGANVFSVDQFKTMTNYVHELNRKLFVIRASGEKLPVTSNTLDLVLALDVIEHLYKPLQLLREVYRVLRRNGILLLTTDNTRVLPPTYWFIRSYRWLARNCLNIYPNHPKMPSQKVSPHIREYSTDEIIALLEAVKFKILKYDTFSEAPFFQFINSLFSFFLRGKLRKYKWESQFVLCAKVV